MHYLKGDPAKNKDVFPERFLSATFQDLPAPNLTWEKMASAPVPRLDGAAIQIKNLLYVFAGYGTSDYVRTFSSSYYLFLYTLFLLLVLIMLSIE